MNELILRLIDAHALNPTPIGDQVVEFYFPFDDLLGGNATEDTLRQAMTRGMRVSLVGPSGCGKSSLCEWVLGAAGGEFAALRVPVSVEEDDTVGSPQAFAQHVIRTVSKQAVDGALIDDRDRRQLLRASSDRMVRPGQETTRKAGLGFPAWLIKGELATDIKTYVESIDQKRSAASIVDALEYLVSLIKHHGLSPVFVIDDSDAWLNVAGVRDRSKLVNDFFGPVLRMMAELDSGLVVAVHNDYLGMAGYKQAEGFLELTVTIPELPSAAAVAGLIERRITACDGSATWEQVFDGRAIDALFGYYTGAGARSIRKVIQAAQSSLYVAAEASAEIVSEAAVDSAISEWS
jgi:energy-coupling factor transporter ATP-binding protein EcfA2